MSAARYIAPNVLEQTRPAYQAQPPRLLDRIREVIRCKHYSLRTEETYVDWARRFVRFCDLRHPRDCGAPEVAAFLTHLANEGRVSASTQNQAKSALLFLYKEVLGSELPWLEKVESSKCPARLPVVLTADEVWRLLADTRGTSGLVLRLLYGTGMRVMEALRLRVKDVEFTRSEIVIREGKGFRDRVTMLPVSLADEFARHLGRVKTLHEHDLRHDRGEVYLPYALARKSIRGRRRSGFGSMFSLRSGSRAIHAAALSGATAPSRSRFSAPCAMRYGMPESPSMQRRTRCATRLPRTCSMPATTSAPSRSCSVTRTCRRR